MNILRYLLRPVFSKVQDYITSGAGNTFSNLGVIRLEVLIPFLIVITFSAICIWHPLLNSIRSNVRASQSMVAIVPLKIMLQVRVLHEFVQKMSQNSKKYA